MSVAPQEPPKEEDALAGFRLSLLGEFALSAPGGQAVAITGKKNRALVAVLALSPGQTMTRERLSSLLWGDRGEEQARNSLRQSLAVLRKELGPDGSGLILSRDEALTLRMEATAVDALEIVAATISDDVAILRAANARCRGELLAGPNQQVHIRRTDTDPIDRNRPHGDDRVALDPVDGGPDPDRASYPDRSDQAVPGNRCDRGIGR